MSKPRISKDDIHTGSSLSSARGYVKKAILQNDCSHIQCYIKCYN